MSLVPVPVCSGCGQVAAVSISCSTCCLLCCGTCFGLTSSDFGGEARLLSLLSVRVCSMCSKPPPVAIPEQVQVAPAAVPTDATVVRDEVSVAPSAVSEEVPTALASIPEQTSAPAAAEREKSSTTGDMGLIGKDNQVRVPEPVVVKRERCWIHGKDLKLFCLQCDECICGECFLDAGGHMRHQIDFVEAVYKEKRAETERKLAALDEKVKNLKQDVVQVEKNLEIVEVAERDVLDEIEAVCEEAKEGIAKLTGQRKRVLKIQAELPAKKQKLNEVLTQMVEKLPPEEFFKQQPQVEKQCDEISQCIPVSNFQPVDFEDIGW